MSSDSMCAFLSVIHTHTHSLSLFDSLPQRIAWRKEEPPSRLAYLEEFWTTPLGGILSGPDNAHCRISGANFGRRVLGVPVSEAFSKDVVSVSDRNAARDL